ncbi:class I SAM-dependent methyltransferase [Specibacter cremeus]|uniref:class I SAM-dependent methyltransferase n=1 Tax=Specibacter cremeus TaxID=1629051 RepID=UPI000F76826B|nr:class I SAM-dependent methyltransferase [Specibacter cremeus]
MAHDFDAALWDARYRDNASVWSGNPNRQLVAEAAGLGPGTALDAGCGEGADAIWLAAHGWRVTAVDFSAVALDRAAAHAAQRGQTSRITWARHDLLDWTPPAAAFDLVSAQFLHLPGTPRISVQERLAAAVAPGGTLLIVGHDASDLHTTIRRPQLPDVFFAAQDVADALDPDEWTVVACESRPRQAHDDDGHAVTVHDAVLRARRHPTAP